MLIQRMVSAISLSLMAWTIYHLKFMFTTPVILAIGVYVLGSLVLAKASQRRNGSKEHAANLNTIGWSTAWTIISSGVLFGLFSTAAIWLKYVAYGSVSNFWLWMLHMIGITVLFLVFLFVIGIHIALQEVAGKAKIQHWYDAPVIAFMLVCKKGGGYLANGTVVLIAIWIACLVDFYNTNPYRSFIAFFILLISLGLLTSASSVQRRNEAAYSAKSTAWVKWTGLSFLFLFILFYLVLAQSWVGILSQLLTFVIFAIITLIILLISSGIIKLRLFVIMKWLLVVCIYPLFAAWMLFMWWFVQP